MVKQTCPHEGIIGECPLCKKEQRCNKQIVLNELEKRVFAREGKLYIARNGAKVFEMKVKAGEEIAIWERWTEEL